MQLEELEEQGYLAVGEVEFEFEELEDLVADMKVSEREISSYVVYKSRSK